MPSERKCAGACGRTLIFNGVHMGVPFTVWKSKKGANGTMLQQLYCGKCYDEITVDDHHVQRTGEQVV